MWAAGHKGRTTTKLSSRLRSMEYESVRTVELAAIPGVSVVISRMSLGRRLSLMEQVREIAKKIEFFEAGARSTDKLEATILSSEVDLILLRWGLKRIDGLTIDGHPATAEALIASGPEEACREIVAAIRDECGLTEEERKN